jgi:hypothetical protein
MKSIAVSLMLAASALAQEELIGRPDGEPAPKVVPFDPGYVPSFEWPKDEVFNRHVMFEGHEYRVEYTFNQSFSSVPATIPPGQPHYSARITVYRDGQKVNKNPILGTYVPQGCFEDVPVEWVKRALAKAKEPEEAVAVLYATNSFPDMTRVLWSSGETNVFSWRFDTAAIRKIIDEELAKARSNIIQRLSE